MAFFKDCYTPDELRQQYLYWVKKLHPDKGGDKADFQLMQNEYEDLLKEINSCQYKNSIPKIFDSKENYEYFRRPVKYVGILYNHYYKFIQEFGADILIDCAHISIIFRKPLYL